MNYQKIYNQFIEKRKNQILTKNKKLPNYIYCETHHIIPQCIGGSDEEFNLVNLTAREHYIAHMLLVKIYPEEYSLLYAIEMMHVNPVNDNNENSRKFRFNSRLFEAVKIKLAKMKSEKQSNLKWIKNLKLNCQAFWPKDTELTEQMIHDGWEFGRLQCDCHKSRSYENAGYEAGKYIRITNDIIDLYILKTDPIPDGFHRGMSIEHRHNQSKGCIGRPGTTTGKKMIINYITKQTRYLAIGESLPDGWHYGSVLKGISRSEEVKNKISISQKGRPKSEDTKKKLGLVHKGSKWYTDGHTNIQLHPNDKIPYGFIPGRTHRSKKEHDNL